MDKTIFLFQIRIDEMLYLSNTSVRVTVVRDSSWIYVGENTVTFCFCKHLKMLQVIENQEYIVDKFSLPIRYHTSFGKDAGNSIWWVTQINIYIFPVVSRLLFSISIR